MLVARSVWSSPPSRLQTCLVIAANVRAHVVERAGLCFDTRFLVGPPRVRHVATVHLVLRGALHTSTGARRAAPVAHLLPEEQFERVTPGAPTFQLSGDPAVVIDVCVPADHVVVDVAGLDRAVEFPKGRPEGKDLGAAVWDAAAEFAAAIDDDGAAAGVRALLLALHGAGVVGDAAVVDVDQPDPPHLQRLWKVLAAVYGRQETAPVLKALAGLVGVSLRQMARDLDDLDERFGLHGGWRASVVVLRLRRAVLLLSAPHLGVADVARTVGYGSIDAMARAFRDAGLPPPSVVRDVVVTS